MPKYKWTGKMTGGRASSGEIVATSSADVTAKLAKIGVTVTKIEEIGSDMPTFDSVVSTETPEHRQRIENVFRDAGVDPHAGAAGVGDIFRVLQSARRNRASLPEEMKRAGRSSLLLYTSFFLALPFAIFYLAPLSTIHCRNQNGSIRCSVSSVALFGQYSIDAPVELANVRSVEIVRTSELVHSTKHGRDIQTLLHLSALRLSNGRQGISTQSIAGAFPPASFAQWRLQRWLAQPDGEITVNQGWPIPAFVGGVCLLLGLGGLALFVLRSAFMT